MAEEFDAVVIGSGPGGGAVAWALATRSVRVLALEAGPACDYTEDYRLHLDTWERSGFPATGREQASYTVAPLQPLEARRDGLRSWNHIQGRSNDTEQREAGEYAHVQGVGGSTLHYLGEAHRLHAGTMRMRSRFGVAADWPLDNDALEPHYLEAERVIGAAGPGAQPGRARSAPHPLPAHRLSYASRKLEAGCRALRLTLAENSLGILSDVYDARPATTAPTAGAAARAPTRPAST